MIQCVTIDDITPLDELCQVLDLLPAITHLRIVCDYKIQPHYYEEAIVRLAAKKKLVLCAVDSSDMKKYTKDQHGNRWGHYLSLFKKQIDIAECGNEIEGNWTGNRTDVLEKVDQALRLARFYGIKQAVTHFYDADNPVLPFIKLPADYHLLSYYERSAKKVVDIKVLLGQLYADVTQGLIGIGEYGAEDAKGDRPGMEEISRLVQKYQGVNPKQPWFCGFYGYWDFIKDCVEGERPLLPLFSKTLTDTSPESDPNHSPGSRS